MQDIQVKLQAFVGTTIPRQTPGTNGSNSKHRMVSITNALYMSTSIEKHQNAANNGDLLDEERPLVQ